MSAATDVDMLALISDARREHLPQPVEVRILPGLRHVQVQVQPADHRRWRGWWTQQGTDPWRLTTDPTPNGWVAHQSTAWCREWCVEIFHLELPALRERLRDPVDVAGDEAAALTAGGAS